MQKGHFNECRSCAWWKSEYRVCLLLATRGSDICRCTANSDLAEWITEAGQIGGLFQDQGQSFPNTFCNWHDCDDTEKECRTSSNLWLDLLAIFVSNSIHEDTIVLYVHSALSLGKAYLFLPEPPVKLPVIYQISAYVLSPLWSLP